MDPTTGRFHELRSEAEEAAADERGWTSFTLGELVSIKGQQFRVVDIATTHVILRAKASETTRSAALLAQSYAVLRETLGAIR